MFSKCHMRTIQRKAGENSRKYLPRAKVRALARKTGKAGGPNSRKYMTPERATELARRANAVRWGRVKAHRSCRIQKRGLATNHAVVKLSIMSTSRAREAT
jgi:hypothetical protein